MMTHLHLIERGLSFIESRLMDEFDLTEVSSAAGMSHFHFQRMFKAITGETLARYVRCRRLAKAADALLSTDRRVIDIAMESGFDAQASFTRAFKKAYGLPPATFRKQEVAPLFLRQIEPDRNYFNHIQHGVVKTPTIMTRPATQAIGMCTRFFGIESEHNNLGTKIVDVWDAFLKTTAHIPAAPDAEYFGIITVADQHTGELEYTACVAIEQNHPSSAPWIQRHIASGLYAVFEHHGETSSLVHTVNYIYGNWLLNTDYQHTYGPDLEIYDHRYQANTSDSMFLYAIPIRRIA